MHFSKLPLTIIVLVIGNIKLAMAAPVTIVDKTISAQAPPKLEKAPDSAACATAQGGKVPTLNADGIVSDTECVW